MVPDPAEPHTFGRIASLFRRRPKDPAPPEDRAWLRTNLEHSLPFLSAGGLTLGIGVWLHAVQQHSVNHGLSLWLLLVAIGATVVGGGVALTLVNAAEDAPEPDHRFILVDRSEYAELRAARQQLESGPTGEPEESPPWAESESEHEAGFPPSPPERPAPAVAAAAGPAAPAVPTAGTGGQARPASPGALPEAETRRPTAGPTDWLEGPRVPASPAPSSGPGATKAEVLARPPPTPAAGARKEIPSPVEASFDELVSELNTIAGEAGAPPVQETPRVTLTSSIARSQNRCTSCARSLEPNEPSVACVSCATPLCPACQEASTRRRGIALCVECARVFDKPEMWFSAQGSDPPE